MTLSFKKHFRIAVILFCLVGAQPSFAFSLDPRQLMEDQLLQIIDEEVLKMVPDPENMEWTEDAGLQPKDTYELDSAEKCELIRHTRNKKALAACAILLGSN